jgi:hypothetical protein
VVGIEFNEVVLVLSVVILVLGVERGSIAES